MSVLGEFVNIFHIWRLLHWCWVTQHICCLFLAREDVLMSWKLTMNRLFRQDYSFFVTDKKWVYWVNLWIFSTFGDLYTDVQWLNTSVVYSSHKRTSLWVETLPWIDCSVMTTFFSNRQIVNVLGEFVNSFHIWRLLHWCWLTLHICLFVLSIRGHTNELKLAMNGLFSQDRSFL